MSFGKPEKFIAAPFESIYKMSEILGKTKRCGAGTRAILPPRELNGRETKKWERAERQRERERKKTSKQEPNRPV